MNKIFISLAISLLFIGTKAQAVTTCDTKTSFFIVEADRKSDPRYSNMLLIKFITEGGDETTCAGSHYAYISNSEAAYDSVMSTVLYLAALDKTARIIVDEKDKIGSAVRLEYLYPKL